MTDKVTCTLDRGGQARHPLRKGEFQCTAILCPMNASYIVAGTMIPSPAMTTAKTATLTVKRLTTSLNVGYQTEAPSQFEGALLFIVSKKF